MGYHTASLWVLWLALGLSDAIDVRTGRIRNHGHYVCSTWGNHHFKTFDGDFYQFPGSCSYNLASDCGESYQEFSVHVHRSMVSGHPHIDKITVAIKDVIIQLKSSIVIVNGAIAKTPYYSFGILIHKNDAYFKLYTKAGLTLMWNKEDAVMLELDPKFNNRTCGLCGDYNGVPLYNEFVSGSIILNPIQFGNLQNIHDPNDECTDKDETQKTDTAQCSQFRSVCEQHLRHEAFSDCESLLNLENYIQACMLDMCSCDHSQDSFCLCSTITEYSRQCSHAGGRPGNWRTDNFCLKQCPANMIYQESASPCKNSCSHLEIHSLCEEHYMDGCFCPEGTVQDDYTNRGCVPVSQCHCKHRDTLYAPGETMENDCNECHCVAGKWSCTDQSCPGVCAIEGGAHFTTFDKKAYTFHGNCYYVISKGNSNESHVILGELTPCSSSERETCLKSVVFLTDNKNNVVIIKADGSVLFNELKITLPHLTASFSVLQPFENYIILDAINGPKMQIQLSPSMQLYITMENFAKGQLQGLCGDFNSKEGDDFKTSGGLVEATASAFVNTWKAQASCHDISDWLEDPCSLSIENKNYAEYWCSNLESDKSAFAKCHSTIDPTEYVKRCRYDSCNCKDSEHCMCAALSSYVRACATKGIILWGWKKGICDKDIYSCPSTQVYLYNLTTCQPTCQSLAEGEKSCHTVFTPVDGCGCPDGQYLNEKDHCVDVSKCPCYYQGTYVQPLDVIYKHEERCSCHHGKLLCITQVNETCPAGKVYFDCNKANSGVSRSTVHRSCKTLGVEYFQTECISGCVCPNGLLDDGAGGCVPEDRCPCVHNEDIYPHGSKVKVDCNTCSCQRGRWTCTNAICYGTCIIYGNGHYITFDEKFYDFDGNCEFVAAQDYCGPNHSEGNFSIIIENIPCGTTGVTCSKSIKVFLGKTVLKLADKHIEETTGEGVKHVTYLTREVGIYRVIEASNGILLIWDRKTTIFIKVSPAYKGKLCGLCGNFDDNSQNDYKTSHMLQVTDVLEFGNSWKLDASCPDAAEIINPCSQNPHRHSWSEKQCGLIKSQVFKVCHSKVDPIPFYEACVNDACSCDSGGDCECFCTAVAAYAQECTKAEACVYWRTPDICPIFCDYYNPEDECEWHYHPCGNHEIQTCRSINDVYTNVTITYLEGCYPSCPEDRPIFDESNKICVTKEDCGCYINNTHYNKGDPVPTTEPCTSCVCISGPNPKCFYDQSACFCMINGTRYEEGEIISTEEQSGVCIEKRCENGEVVVNFTVCATTVSTTTSITTVTTTPTVSTTTVTTPVTTTSPPSTTCVLQKVCLWTEWFDVSKPEADVGSGDYETYDEIRKHHTFCDVPEQIQCRAANAPDVSLDELKQVVYCNVSYGLICRNSEQSTGSSLWQKCFNYEIRVDCCHYECVHSTTPATTAPTTTTSTTTTTTTTTSPTTTPPTTSPTTTPPSTTSPTTTPPTTTSPTTTPPTTTSPTTTTVTTTIGTTTSVYPPCDQVCSWSPWFDVSYPKYEPNGGDFETYENIKNAGLEMCKEDMRPENISCRATKLPDMTLDQLGQTLTCDVSTGLICYNKDQTGFMPVCYNYEISVYCCRPECTTTTPTTTTTTTTPSTTTTISESTTPEPTSTSTKTTTTSPTTTSVTTTLPTTVTTTECTTEETGETTPTPTPTSTTPDTCDPDCKWSQWFDVSYPKYEPNGGDFETYENIIAGGLEVCKRPENISCRATKFPDMTLDQVGQTLTCDVSTGLICYNKDQTGFMPVCYNYEISVYCCRPLPEDCKSATTKTTTATTPTTTKNTTSVTTTPTTTTTESTTPTTTETTTTSETTTPTTTTTESTTPTTTETTTSVTTTPTTTTTESTTPTTTETTSTSVTTTPTTTTTESTTPTTTETTTTSETTTPTTTTTESTTPTTTETTTSVTTTPTTTTTESTTPTTTETTTTSETTTPTTTTTESTTPTTTETTTSVTTTPTTTTTESTTPTTTETTTTSETTTPTTTTTESTTPTTTETTTSVTTTPTTTTTESTTPTTTETTTTSETTTPTTTTTESTTTTKFTTTSGICDPFCTWSPWFDVSYPKYEPNGGDFETYKNITNAGLEVCEGDMRPEDISCRAQKFPDMTLDQLGQTLTCDVSTGLICYNKDQTGFMPVCYNYEISVYCCQPLPDFCTSPTTTTTTTTSDSASKHTESTTPTPGVTTTKSTTTSPTTTSVTTTLPTTVTTTECTTEETPETTPTSRPSTVTPTCDPFCTWSQWFDVSTPKYEPNGGDFETYENINNAGFEVCEGDMRPENISCRATKYPDRPLYQLGQMVTCDVSIGLICNNKDLIGYKPVCYNYEISVYCCRPLPDFCTTTTSTTTTSTTTSETTTTTSTSPTTTSETTTTPVITSTPEPPTPTITKTTTTTSVTTTSSPSTTTETTPTQSTSTSPTTTTSQSTNTPIITSTPEPSTPTITKTTTTTSVTTSSTIPNCDPVCKWSQWFDVSTPKYEPNGGDFETYENIENAGYEVCEGDMKPENISCRATKYPDKPLYQLGQMVTCDVSIGLICNNNDLIGYKPVCYNYEISVYCCQPLPDNCPTTPYTTTTTTTTTSPTTTTSEWTTTSPTTTTAETTTTSPTTTTTATSTTSPTTTTSEWTTTSPTTTTSETTTTSPTTTTTATSTNSPTTHSSEWTTTSPTTTTSETTTTSPTTTTSETTTTSSTTTTSETTTTSPTTTTSETTTTSVITSTPEPPTSTTTTATTTSVTTSSTTPNCDPVCKWSQWFDVSTPKYEPNGGDFETYENIKNAGFEVCEGDIKPENISCRATKYPDKPLHQLGQMVTCDVSIGLICNNNDLIGYKPVCYNYEISVYCCQPLPDNCPTTPYTTTTTTTTTSPTTTTSEWTTTSPTTTTAETTTTSPTTTTTATSTTSPTTTTSEWTTTSPTTTTSETTTTSPTTTTTATSTNSPTTHSSEWTTTSPTTTTSETTTISPTTTTTATTTTSPTTTTSEWTTTSPTTTTSETTTTSPTTTTTATSTNSPTTHSSEWTTTSPTTTTSETTTPSPTTTTSEWTTTSPTTTTSETTTTSSTTTTATSTNSPTTHSSEWTTTSPTTTTSETTTPSPTTTTSEWTTTTSPTTTTSETTTTSSTTTTSEMTTTSPATTTSETTTTSVITSTPEPPTSTTTTATTTSVTTFSTTPNCDPDCKWSPWFDVSYPKYEPNGGDFETYKNITNAGLEVCEGDMRPEDISCRAQKFPDMTLDQLGQTLTCDVSTGLICYNKDQTGFMPVCYNYEISVYCCRPLADFCTSPTTTTTTTTSDFASKHTESTTPTPGVTTTKSTTTSPTTTSVTTTLPTVVTTTECTTEETPETTPTSSPSTVTPNCDPSCTWSPWFDVSYPKYEPNGGDFETYKNITNAGYQVCEGDMRPENISCRAQKFPDMTLDQLGQTLTCDVSTGLICYNKDQTGFMPVCYNYEISVYCCRPLPEECFTTTSKTTTTTTSPTTTTSETTTTSPITTTTETTTTSPTTTTTETTTTSPTTTTTSETTTPSPTTTTSETTTTSPTTTTSETTTTSPTTTTSETTTPSPTTTTSETTTTSPTTTTSETTTPSPTTTTSETTTTSPTTTTSETTTTSVITSTPEPTTSTTSTATTTSMTASSTTPNCDPVCKWSQWFDVSTPKYEPNGGDFETYENIKNAGFEVCEGDMKPENISCRATKYPDRPLYQLGQMVTCDVSIGLICNNNDLIGYKPVCYNYEISVYCCRPLPDYCPTTTYTTTTTTTSPTTTSETTTSPTTTTSETTTTSPTTTTSETTTTSPTTTTSETTTLSPTTTTSETTTSSPTTTTSETTTTSPTTTTTESTTTSVITTTPESPTSTTLTATTTSVAASSTTPNCDPVCKWSQWFDVSTPKYEPNGGDFETYENIENAGFEVCEGEMKPENISCRATKYPDRPLYQLGQMVTCDVSIGLICNNKDLIGYKPVCYNYEISVYCCRPLPDYCPTTAHTTTTTTTTTPTTTTTETTTISPTTITTTTITTRTPTPSVEIRTPPTTTLPTPPSEGHNEPTTTSPTTTKSSTSSVTTTPETTTTSETTIMSSTPCVCLYHGTPYPPDQTITTGVVNETCYEVICTKQCELQVNHWNCPSSTTTSPSTSTQTSTTTTTTTTPTTTSTTKSTTTTSTVMSTSKKPGCPFDPYREHNETWMLCNCTMARCLENNTVEIVELKCEPPPKITCANGLQPIAVPDEDLCCWHWECDCVCNGWGDPHYITFDGTYYSFQGNCTYTLVEEIDKKIDNFGVYIDNYDCGAQDRVSCPRDIIVQHESQIIRIKAKSLTPISLQVVINDEIVGLPYKKYGVKVYKSGINYVVEIPELETNITYNGLSFSVKLPYRLFGHNTQGQCGTCTNSKTDDCRLPNGTIISNCEIMADAWIVSDPRKPECGHLRPTRPPKVTVPPTPCKPSPLCDLLLEAPFKECHKTLSPNDFYKACQFDSCHVPNSNIECTSLQQYAFICGDQGVCIDWRSKATECPLSCPSSKVYKACGPVLSQTCETTPEENAQIAANNRTVEGCFCPPGTMPFSQAVDICVETCGCVGTDNIPRQFGEQFQHNCQDCICREGGIGITCQEHECKEMKQVTCNLEGFYPEIQINPTDSCCNETVCKCDTKLCSTKSPNCKLGYEVVGSIPDGHCCPVYTCVRKNVCVHGNAEYLPGAPVFSDKCQSCVCTEDDNSPTGLEIKCTHVPCNIECPIGFELRQNTKDCCGVCEQTHCVINYGGSYKLMKPGTTLYAENNNCTVYSCVVLRNQFITSVSEISCPLFNEDLCEPDTIQLLPNGCCKICIEKTSSCHLQTSYDYLVYNNCRSENRVRMARCDGTCGTYSLYSAQARAMSHKCTCCQEVQTSQKHVKLQCSDGSEVDHEYIDVEKCDCMNTDCGHEKTSADQTPVRARRFVRRKGLNLH
ncbi:mucin-2-like [Bufo bufo]|uniref:mucin-2-like n=1 Tax=Bufo bufo TaxID=8384 RepID=UPI001ABDF65D|nr:mucin-2-like [Bufo bufo]